MNSWKNNRYHKTKPKLGIVWCGGCDRNLVGRGRKCDVCGYIEKSKSFKIKAR